MYHKPSNLILHEFAIFLKKWSLQIEIIQK